MLRVSRETTSLMTIVLHLIQLQLHPSLDPVGLADYLECIGELPFLSNCSSAAPPKWLE